MEPNDYRILGGGQGLSTARLKLSLGKQEKRLGNVGALTREEATKGIILLSMHALPRHREGQQAPIAPFAEQD